MRDHAPFHSQALNRSSSMLKKQLSICKSVSLSFLSNEPELVCSKAQMGISGPIQQQGVCYYNNWQLPGFLKSLKAAMWEMAMEQEGGDGCRCSSWAPQPQPFPNGASPMSHQPWDQLGSAPLQEEMTKPPEPTLWRAAAAPNSGLVLSSTCELCPLHQAVCPGGWMSRDAARGF